MTGQGAVSNPIPSGAQAPTIPLSGTLAPTTAVIGSANATVLGSVLCPGFVGLLQVNIVVPEIAAGDQTVVVAIGGSASNSAVISIASAH
jgi:adhesin/invasin